MCPFPVYCVSDTVLELLGLIKRVYMYYQEYATATGDEIRHWASATPLQCVLVETVQTANKIHKAAKPLIKFIEQRACTDSDHAPMCCLMNLISGFHSFHKYTL